jgi:MFS family permease
MNPIEILAAAPLLVAAVAAGTVAHELLHAAALRAFGVPYRIEWLPGRDGAGLLEASLYVKWAAVTPTAFPDDMSAWRLRVAALAPVALATPFVLIAAGPLPDPFATGAVLAQVLAIAVMACAIPSPQDFSLFWHAERALAEHEPA